MDTMPWNYWTEDGKAKPETTEILTALESVLKRNPNHPGACHYFIHAVEASPNPECGLAAAHRLRNLVSARGTWCICPATFTCAWDNTTKRRFATNARWPRTKPISSVRTPRGCIRRCIILTIFISSRTARAWKGAVPRQLRAGRKLAAKITKMEIEHMPMAQWLKATPYFVLARFGHWDQLLHEPKPDADWLYVNAMWHFVRGMAFIRTDKLADAEREFAKLEKIAGDEKLKSLEMPDFPGATLVGVAAKLLSAELAVQRGETDAHLRGLQEAVAAQDKLPYMEPPFWYFPIRHSKRRARSGRPLRRGGKGLSPGPQAPPGEWLVAIRIASMSAGSGKNTRRGELREEIPRSLEARRPDADEFVLLELI